MEDPREYAYDGMDDRGLGWDEPGREPTACAECGEDIDIDDAGCTNPNCPNPTMRPGEA